MTKGQKFLKHFINMREKSPSRVFYRITEYLDDIGVDYEEPTNSNDGLSDIFFKNLYFLFINHKHDTLDGKSIIIGKGITFDSGGYDLKTSMKDMFYDKNGALLAIANSIDTGYPALVFFADNMIHDEAPVAGQIIKEYRQDLNVLIDDTDAEGRIGLATCLNIAQGYRYTKFLTIATLTGHAHNITGDRTYAMVHSNKPNDLIEIMRDVVTSDLEGSNRLEMWPAPYHKDYDKSIDTKIKGADISNCGTFKGAGTSTAFSFLKRFVDNGNHLIHLDIAAMMLDKHHNGYEKFGWKEVPYLLNLLDNS